MIETPVVIDSLPASIGPLVTRAHLSQAVLIDHISLNTLTPKYNPSTASQQTPIIKEMRLFTKGHGIMVLTAKGTVRVICFSVVDNYELQSLPVDPQAAAQAERDAQVPYRHPAVEVGTAVIKRGPGRPPKVADAPV